MRAALPALALLAALLAAAPELPPLPFELRVQGNKVLPAAVYEAVLHPSPAAGPDAATAAWVAEELRGFLRRSGYELAEVRAEVKGRAIEVTVDEGQLERVVFKGPLTVARVRLALGLAIPHQVFNRPDLVAQVRRLEQVLDAPVLWQLVSRREVQHWGPQLTTLPTIRGFSLIPPDERRELHVNLGEPDWAVGLGFDVRTSYFDGLELGLHYHGSDALAVGDRWRLAGGAAMGVRGELIPFTLVPAFSRAYAAAQWFAPRLAETARPFLALDFEQVSRVRRDVNLLTYQYSSGELSLNVGFTPASILDINVSLGVQVRALYAMEAVDPALPSPAYEAPTFRPYGAVSASLLFTPRDERFDQEHRLLASVRYYVGAIVPGWGEARLRYRKTFHLGWHELRVKVSGVYLWGPVAFHNEEPLPDPHLRGVFANIWVKRAGSASGEFRFSLIRDALLVGVFADVAAFGDPDRIAGTETFGFGVSAGPGVHVLLEGTIQFDLTFSFGLLTNGAFRFGPMLLVNKVL